MAGPADLGYDLIPPDPGLLSPDLALDATLAPVVDLADPTPVALGKGWSFDFITRQFFRSGNAPAEVYDTDHLRVWIEKTLRTAQGAHPIYTDAYGIEDPDLLIGEPLDSELLATWERTVVEALMVHDRIAAVDDFYYTSDPMDDALYVDFAVTLDSSPPQMLQVGSFRVQAVTA